MKSIAVIALLLVCLSASAVAAADTAPGIEVAKAWARATPAGAKTGAVYLTLLNKGKVDDRLVGVSTPAAGTAQLHTESMDGGVMKMRPVAGVDVKAGGQAVLAPGGTHVMLIGLTKRLVAGASFPLTLQFEKAGAIATDVTVAAAGAMKKMDMKDMDMKGMDMGDTTPGGAGK